MAKTEPFERFAVRVDEVTSLLVNAGFDRLSTSQVIFDLSCCVAQTASTSVGHPFRLRNYVGRRLRRRRLPSPPPAQAPRVRPYGDIDLPTCSAQADGCGSAEVSLARADAISPRKRAASAGSSSPTTPW